jgi:hypothetical protein
MSNGVTELDALIPELWSTNMYDELRQNLPMANFFSREYEGEIRNLGDKVNVHQIGAATGEILTDDKATFSSEEMVVNEFQIVADKRAIASFEFTDLAQLQSMSFEQSAQEALVYAVRKQIEEQVKAALVPVAGHQINPVSASDLDAVDVAKMRTLLSQALVPTTGRGLFLDPAYFGDILQKTTFTSSDFVSNGAPISSGMFASPLYGFQIVENDNLAADVGYACHPSALQVVIQRDLRLKISDLHAQKKMGYLMSADIIFGLKLFDANRIVKISG